MQFIQSMWQECAGILHRVAQVIISNSDQMLVTAVLVIVLTGLVGGMIVRKLQQPLILGYILAGVVVGIFFKAGMALGGVVPGIVLAIVGFNAELPQQTALAEQGILWLVCVIPAVLLVLAIYIISKYELEDDVVDQINTEIEARNNN